MTAVYITLCGILIIIVICQAECMGDLKKRNTTQKGTIIALGIELSEANEEIERLKARLGAKENHRQNILTDREREAMEALHLMERRKKIHERIEKAKGVAK